MLAQKLRDMHTLAADSCDPEFSRVLLEAADEIERLRAAVSTVLTTFEKDEAQGYRSKDRQFAISILRQAFGDEQTRDGGSGDGR